MAAKWTLTGDIAGLTGGASVVEDLTGYVITSEGPKGAILDTDADQVLLGTWPITFAEDGTFSVADLPASDDAAYAPSGHMFRVVISWYDPTGRRGHGYSIWQSAFFDLTADLDLSDVPLASLPVVISQETYDRLLAVIETGENIPAAVDAAIDAALATAIDAALDSEIAARNLVETSDLRIGQLTDVDHYADFTVDVDGRLARGLRKVDGVNEFPLVESKITTTDDLNADRHGYGAGAVDSIAALSEATGFHSGTKDVNGRLAEDALGTDGRVPAWVLQAWANRMPGVQDLTKWDVIIGAGQSNMSGVTRTTATTETDPIDTRIYTYDTGGSVVQAGPTLPWWDGSTGPSPLMEFARDYANRTRTGRNVLVLPAAYGGTGFSDFASSPTDRTWDVDREADPNNLHARLKAQVTAAIAALSALGATDVKWAGMLWMQGDRDLSTMTATAYRDKMDQLFAAVRTHVGVSTLPILIGSMVPQYDTPIESGIWGDIDKMQREAPLRLERTAYVRGPHKERQYAVSNHYSARGERVMGRMLAAAYRRACLNVTGNDPTEPLDVRVVRAGGGKVDVFWTHPECRVTTFTAQYRLDGGSWVPVTLSSPLATYFQITTSAALVEVEVTTTNAAGTSYAATGRA